MEPQVSLNGFPGAGLEFIQTMAFFAMVWGFVGMVFWMVCAWRAMRAHERLADAAEKMASGKPLAAAAETMISDEQD